MPQEVFTKKQNKSQKPGNTCLQERSLGTDSGHVETHSPRSRCFGPWISIAFRVGRGGKLPVISGDEEGSGQPRGSHSSLVSGGTAGRGSPGLCLPSEGGATTMVEGTCSGATSPALDPGFSTFYLSDSGQGAYCPYDPQSLHLKAGRLPNRAVARIKWVKTRPNTELALHECLLVSLSGNLQALKQKRKNHPLSDKDGVQPVFDEFWRLLWAWRDHEDRPGGLQTARVTVTPLTALWAPLAEGNLKISGLWTPLLLKQDVVQRDKR